MDTEPLIEPKNKSKIKRQKAKGKNRTQPTHPYAPLSSAATVFGLHFDFGALPFDFLFLPLQGRRTNQKSKGKN